METMVSEPLAPSPTISFQGEKVAVGPLHSGLIPLLSRWDSDFETRMWSGDELLIHTPEHLEKIFKGFIEEPKDDKVFMAFYDRVTLQPIGWGNIRDINTYHQTCELGIGIGEPEYRGRGYGSEAVRLMVDFAFTAYNIRNVLLDTNSFNQRAFRAYQKVGFKEIGRRRQATRYGNRLFDIIYMDCLAEEFYQLHQSVFSIPEE
jgi:RimJ/RimL family protein N-acetyltransferase